VISKKQKVSDEFLATISTDPPDHYLFTRDHARFRDRHDIQDTGTGISGLLSASLPFLRVLPEMVIIPPAVDSWIACFFIPDYRWLWIPGGKYPELA
jgi:hypothetical protein